MHVTRNSEVAHGHEARSSCLPRARRSGTHSPIPAGSRSGSPTRSSSTCAPGGGASFRWDNGEERHAVVEEVEPEERLALRWDDGEPGEVEFTLADADAGTRLTVVETAPSWSTALEVQALALAVA